MTQEFVTHRNWGGKWRLEDQKIGFKVTLVSKPVQWDFMSLLGWQKVMTFPDYERPYFIPWSALYESQNMLHDVGSR